MYCIRRMAYSFGDVKDSSPEVCKQLHKFAEDWYVIADNPLERLKMLLCNDKVRVTQEIVRMMFPSEWRRYSEITKAKTSITAYVLLAD